MQVLVRDNNVDQALKVLKKKMQREGVFREMKLHGHYEKPSERRIREKSEAIRRARKLARKKLQREGLLPMKPRVTPGVMGRSSSPRPPASDNGQAAAPDLMASEIKVTPQNAEMVEQDSSDTAARFRRGLREPAPQRPDARYAASNQMRGALKNRRSP